MLTAVILCAVPALLSAASADERADCEKLKGDQSIRACTQIIEAGTYPAAVMAIAYHNRGLEYFNQGNYEQAISDYGVAISLNPRDGDVYNDRGTIYHIKRSFERALSDFDTAIALNPRHALAYNNRGIVHDDMGEFEQAIADFDRAIAIDPSYAGALNNRGHAYAKNGQYARAIEDFDEAIAINSYDAVFYRNRAKAYQNLGQYELAAADYREALELKPNDSATTGLRVVEALIAAKAKADPAIPAEDTSFRQMQNTDLVGALIAKASANSLAECEKGCASNDACKAYSFNVWNSLCFLKKEPTLRVLEPSTVSGLKSGTYPPPISDAAPAMVRYRNKLFPGTPAQQSSEPRFEDCEARCLASEDCVAFSFIKAESACNMFEKAGEYSGNDGADSGAKRQTVN